MDAEKVSGENQHLFKIKTFNKVGIKRKFLNIMKVIYKKLTANIT